MIKSDYELALQEERIESLKREYDHYMKLIHRAESKAKAHVVKLNGDAYKNESELQEAYGCGMITFRQFESAMTKFKNWETKSQAQLEKEVAAMIYNDISYIKDEIRQYKKEDIPADF